MERQQPVYRLGGCCPERGRRAGSGPRRAAARRARLASRLRAHLCAAADDPHRRPRPRRVRRDWIPVGRSWRLNSNHYGALQGRDKARVLAEAGEQQFMAWRRSYQAAPPPLGAGAEYSQFADPRYAALPPEARPRTESLRDVAARLLPYWYDAIVPDLRTGACVL